MFFIDAALLRLVGEVVEQRHAVGLGPDAEFAGLGKAAVSARAMAIVRLVMSVIVASAFISDSILDRP